MVRREASGLLRFGADTGGTFTDLVVAGDPGGARLFKRPTTPADPVEGVLDVVGAAAEGFGVSTPELLGRGELFVFGTTRATNAIVEGATARTALLVTAGHPDILTLREGAGRPSLFDYRYEYPAPYVPRALTYEIPERVGAGGEVVQPLDEAGTRALLAGLRSEGVEAVAVCLLWSILNPAHELRLRDLLAEELPGVPVTLSHELNPTIREYRRASATAIDASLKPLMSRFFGELEGRLSDAGFGGRMLVMTSSGGVLDGAQVRERPIHSIGSGPAAAPVAGRHFAARDADADTAIVTDAGGTTFDVSLVRRGQLPWTRETVVGDPTFGHLTGFPSVDARSVGAGGGSIAWVDEGGLLHVGPRSAGAMPGPACYGQGGRHTTVTDACLVLRQLDGRYFLGGEMALDLDLARAAILREVAEPLGLDVEAAAAAIVELGIEHMVRAIEGMTLVQGIDPASAVMIGGGGGAGLYACAIARRLETPLVIVPEVSATLSAVGTLLSDLQSDFASTYVTATDTTDLDGIAAVVHGLRARAEGFLAGLAREGATPAIELSVEARYPQQVWEIEVPLEPEGIVDGAGLQRLRERFHLEHDRLFAVTDRASEVEIVTWRARARLAFDAPDVSPHAAEHPAAEPVRRPVRFPGDDGPVDAAVWRIEQIAHDAVVAGPAIIESPFTSVVVEPGATVQRTATGSLLLHPTGAAGRAGTVEARAIA
jgi:N-methylhydantoinase A